MSDPTAEWANVSRVMELVKQEGDARCEQALTFLCAELQRVTNECEFLQQRTQMNHERALRAEAEGQAYREERDAACTEVARLREELHENGQISHRIATENAALKERLEEASIAEYRYITAHQTMREERDAANREWHRCRARLADAEMNAAKRLEQAEAALARVRAATVDDIAAVLYDAVEHGYAREDEGEGAVWAPWANIAARDRRVFRAAAAAVLARLAPYATSASRGPSSTPP